MVTTPVAGWYPVLAAALPKTASQNIGPVRGISPDVVAAVAAVPPAFDAMGDIARGLVRRIHRPSSGRGPWLAEAELGGLWLDAVVEALLQHGQHPRRKVRVAGIGEPPPGDSCYLLSAAVSATLVWRPHRWHGKSPDAALAQWLLISANGDVLGRGIEKSPPLA